MMACGAYHTRPPHHTHSKDTISRSVKMPYHRVSAIIPHKNRNESRSHLIMDSTRSHSWVSEAFLHECLRYNDDLFFNSYPYLRTLPSGMGSEEKCCSEPSTAQHPSL